MEWFINFLGGFFVFAFGAAIGSFLNVVAYRVPRGKSIVLPQSACPYCQTPISARALIPILGWFLIRGRCEHCRSAVSARYPIVEFLTACLTLVVFLHYYSFYEFIQVFTSSQALELTRFRFGKLLPFLSALWILYTGIALSLIDLDFRILPDKITLPGIGVGIVLGGLNPELGWQGAIFGACLGGGSLYLLAKVYALVRGREGMGLGDVKYLAFLGAVVGWQGVVGIIFLASFLGALVGMGYALYQRSSLAVALPFGPFLALGGLVMVLWGAKLMDLFYSLP